MSMMFTTAATSLPKRMEPVSMTRFSGWVCEECEALNEFQMTASSGTSGTCRECGYETQQLDISFQNECRVYDDDPPDTVNRVDDHGDADGVQWVGLPTMLAHMSSDGKRVMGGRSAPKKGWVSCQHALMTARDRYQIECNTLVAKLIQQVQRESVSIRPNDSTPASQQRAMRVYDTWVHIRQHSTTIQTMLRTMAHAFYTIPTRDHKKATKAAGAATPAVVTAAPNASREWILALLVLYLQDTRYLRDQEDMTQFVAFMFPHKVGKEKEEEEEEEDKLLWNQTMDHMTRIMTHYADVWENVMWKNNAMGHGDRWTFILRRVGWIPESMLDTDEVVVRASQTLAALYHTVTNKLVNDRANVSTRTVCALCLYDQQQQQQHNNAARLRICFEYWPAADREQVKKLLFT